MALSSYDRSGDAIILTVITFAAVMYGFDAISFTGTVVTLLFALTLAVINLPYRLE